MRLGEQKARVAWAACIRSFMDKSVQTFALADEQFGGVIVSKYQSNSDKHKWRAEYRCKAK